MVAKRGFGQIQRLPSRRYRARYAGPDGTLCNAPSTFETRLDAEGWLTDERRLIAAGTWLPPTARAKPHPVQAARPLGDYAENWIVGRALKPRTREHYRRLLDRQILPRLGDLGLAAITPDVVRAWWVKLGDRTPTLRAHAYSLLRSILHDAVADGLITANPCHIRGAGNAKRVHRIKPASLAELEVLVGAMPRRYRAMVLLAA